MLSFPEYMTCAETLQDYWFGPVVFISGNNVMLLIVLGVTISCKPLLQKAYSQHFITTCVLVCHGSSTPFDRSALSIPYGLIRDCNLKDILCLTVIKGKPLFVIYDLQEAVWSRQFGLLFWAKVSTYKIMDWISSFIIL